MLSGVWLTRTPWKITRTCTVLRITYRFRSCLHLWQTVWDKLGLHKLLFAWCIDACQICTHRRLKKHAKLFLHRSPVRICRGICATSDVHTIYHATMLTKSEIYFCMPKKSSNSLILWLCSITNTPRTASRGPRHLPASCLEWCHGSVLCWCSSRAFIMHHWSWQPIHSIIAALSEDSAKNPFFSAASPQMWTIGTDLSAIFFQQCRCSYDSSDHAPLIGRL